MSSRTVAALAGSVVLATALAACGGSDEAGASGDELSVATSFYPLQYVTERIAGDTATVTSLTPPGAEPHDLEMTPKDVAAVTEADLVVYLGGFQPTVDEAAAQNVDEAKRLDVAGAAKLMAGHAHEHEGEGEGEDEHGHEEEEGGQDPHFWLDPTRLSSVADAVEQSLAKASPADAATFEANLTALKSDLTTLDGEFEKGLANCASKELVTSHEAFGYLAARYGMEQEGITGISPDQEPDAATLASVTRFVREHDVRTIYYETLVSPAIAKTVATETGATTAVLDPIEGVTDESPGDDYLSIMRANLTSLQKGQNCT